MILLISKEVSKFSIMETVDWIKNYIENQKNVLDSLPINLVSECIVSIRDKYINEKRIFVFGNGGSASNASHFATDLGKSSSDIMRNKFNVLSLNDNISWITAIANDYNYDDIYKRQLENYGSPGDLVISLSVSGNSPNVVKACRWAKENGLEVMAFVGKNGGILAELADKLIVVDSRHYGRDEDCQMTICHLICYAFVELDHTRA